MPSIARRLALAASALVLVPVLSFAQAYPSKPIKIVVSFTAGGTTDILARFLAQNLSERYKQPVVVENKPGAGGNIGSELVVHSPPDGHTLLVGSVGPIAVNPSLKQLPYDPQKDLVAVAQIADVANVLVVHPSMNVKTVQQLVAWGKANPDGINYASTGVGTAAHLSGFMFAQRAGLKAQHIPYKGAEALKDLLAGRVQYMFATIPSVISHIRAGTLVPIGVSTAKRSRSLPEVPTVADSGFPGFEAASWFGVFAPKGTPDAVVAELNRATNEFLKDPKVEARLVQEGADPVAISPREFAQFVAAETDKWRVVVKESGATSN
jgi:tripartite-type tricarboxylate transporter receptor subunit TctC